MGRCGGGFDVADVWWIAKMDIDSGTWTTEVIVAGTQNQPKGKANQIAGTAKRAIG